MCLFSLRGRLVIMYTRLQMSTGILLRVLHDRRIFGQYRRDGRRIRCSYGRVRPRATGSEDIIASLPRHYCLITASLPRHYCPITASVLPHYRVIIAPLPRHYCPITASLPRHYCLITASLLPHYRPHRHLGTVARGRTRTVVRGRTRPWPNALVVVMRVVINRHSTILLRFQLIVFRVIHLYFLCLINQEPEIIPEFVFMSNTFRHNMAQLV